MTRKISLIDMKPNQSGKIVNLIGGQCMLRNLENMGIRIGAVIKKVNQQFMDGPVVVTQHHTTVAIGCGMAKKIIVEISAGK